MPAPDKPAPDHNLPGRLSKRSDRRFESEGYGTGTQMAAYQDAAGGPPPSPAAGAGGAVPPSGAPAPSDDPMGVFAPQLTPTSSPVRPNVKIEPDDPDLALRALYAANPHPDILFLLEQRR